MTQVLNIVPAKVIVVAKCPECKEMTTAVVQDGVAKLDRKCSHAVIAHVSCGRAEISFSKDGE